MCFSWQFRKTFLERQKGETGQRRQELRQFTVVQVRGGPQKEQCTVALKKCPDMRTGGMGESTGYGHRLDVPEESRITCSWGRGRGMMPFTKLEGMRENAPTPPAYQGGWGSWRQVSRRKPKPGSLPRAPAREGWAREGCPVWYQTSG